MLVIFTHVFKVLVELLVIIIMFSFGYCASVERLAGRIVSKMTRYVLSRTLNVTGLSLTLDWVLPLFCVQYQSSLPDQTTTVASLLLIVF